MTLKKEFKKLVREANQKIEQESLRAKQKEDKILYQLRTRQNLLLELLKKEGTNSQFGS